MAGTHEGIDQGDAGAGLAGAGGHDEEEIALLLFDAFHHRTDGVKLVVAAGNSGVDEFLRQRLRLRRM